MRMTRFMSGCLAVLWTTSSLSVLACSPDGTLSRFAHEQYGERIEFDVLRNGKPIGEHVTLFEYAEDGLRVRSRTELGVKFLFIPVYGFEYESSERWCGDQLRELDARVSDGGELSTLAVVRAP